MKISHTIRTTMLLWTVSAIVVFGAPFIVTPPLVSTHAEARVDMSIPTRLIIPSLQIDAAVEIVGLTSDGSMEAPRNPEDVAWLATGTYPGSQGSAVMAGHSGWSRKGPTAFNDLRKMSVGDVMYSKDATGDTTTFVVRSMRKYGATDIVDEVFASKNDGRVYLNLITCEGEWNKETASYPERLVVFAEKI